MVVALGVGVVGFFVCGIYERAGTSNMVFNVCFGAGEEICKVVFSELYYLN